MTRRLLAAALLGLLAAACAPREGAVSGGYAGAAAGIGLRDDARLR